MTQEVKREQPLFQYLNSINLHKEYLMETKLSPDDYNPYQINRGLSYFIDSIMYSNEMNMSYHISKKMQHDFFFYGINPRRRFSKWFKSIHSDDFSCVKEYYKYNDQRTKEALEILSKSQIDEIRRKLEKGGQVND